ncbi:MAG: long-chain fatty acid--CoA ligase [Myxococcales bacterium]|nr:long-chain fatty acid--CoA ligase [Myxococcales bacterium]
MQKFPSVAAMFRARVQETPNTDAFYAPEGESGWKTYSWKQVGDIVFTYAAGLRALGVADGERAAILCGTRVEWLFADIAINCAGAATTTIYPTTTPEDIVYIVTDSDSKVIFAEDDKQVAKLVAHKAEMPDVVAVVNIDGKGGHDGWVLSLAEFEAKGKAHHAANPSEGDAIIDRIQPENLATLIYTSGTTGKPKGVRLMHDGWTYIGEALAETGVLGPTDKQYLWLPLSHSFGKMLEVAVIALAIPTAVDGRIPKIVDNLAVIQPTFMAAAPRIFEKVYNKVVNGAQQAGGLKFKIFKWSMGIGKEVSKIKQAGKEPTGLLAFQFNLADKLVFSKLRARFGGRIRFFISGSAPLNREIAEFFHAAGLLILEGYGLTESSAASFCNWPHSNKFGTVGPPMPGTELKIADDGEILIKSRGVMRGYHNLPDVTEETLKDGWLYTGDIGEVDADGHLRITDRKKNLIKTSGGKYVAPQSIEGSFKAICPYVSQMLVHGDRRNFCSALITMDEEAIMPWAKEQGIAGDYAAVAADARTVALFQGYVDQLNTQLARYETIKKFALLPADFTVETGELTPSLKVKRKEVEKKYAHLLDGFYAGAMADI